MVKLVHASQNLAHCIDFLSREIMAAPVNLTVRTDSKPYDRLEIEVD